MGAQTARSSKHGCGSQALSCTTNCLHPREQRANQPRGMHPKPMPQRAVKRECAAELEGVAALVEHPETVHVCAGVTTTPVQHGALRARPQAPSPLSATSMLASTSENGPLRPRLQGYATVSHCSLAAPRRRGLPAMSSPATTPQWLLLSCRVSSAAWLTGHQCATCSVTACCSRHDARLDRVCLPIQCDGRVDSRQPTSTW
jgi:hypothetical protein